MTPGEILTVLPQIYQALQSAWVADDGGFPVPADTLIVACDTACTPVWLALQRSRFILSSWKVILGSQAAPGISLRRMVLSTGPAHGHRCTGLASTARSLTCHGKSRVWFSVQGIVW